jgi:urease accessory protein
LVLRGTPESVYLVGGAGGPLGGDDLTIEIDVRPGAELTVRSAAASVALPGHGPGPSRLRVQAEVGAGATLRWMPEPFVAAAGCDHRTEVTVAVGRGGRLVWREELVLGRHREASGSVTSRLQVDFDGRPLLRHELGLGPRHPGAASHAVVGPARAVGSVLVVDPAWQDAPPAAPPPRDGAAAVLALDGPAVQLVALAGDALDLRHALDAGLAGLAAQGVCPVTVRGTNWSC